ncbi:McrB family protein [Corynebacterium sp. S7]
MQFPLPADPIQPINHRFQVSPSLPEPKLLIAAIIALYEAFDHPSELDPQSFSPSNGTGETQGIKFTDEVEARLLEYFEKPLQSNSVDQSTFLDAISKNPLNQSQYEPLNVALELVWGLGSLEFSSQSNSGSERTGGVRYPKRIIFSAALDIIDALIQSQNEEFTELLFAWMLGQDPSSELAKAEALLVQTLTVLGENSVYKLATPATSNETEKDLYFRFEGIYRALEISDSVSLDTSNGKGAQRIIKSGLQKGLNRYVTKESSRGNNVTRRDEVSIEKLENYTKRVLKLLSFSNRSFEEIDAPTVQSNHLSREVDRYYHPRNLIFYGVPGSGKSYQIKRQFHAGETNLIRVVFHPEYSYSDFVGQILPQVSESDVTYSFVPGPFTKILKAAIEDPDQDYYLIIEEINRANAAGVFGDLFQLLDRNKDGSSEYFVNNPEIANFVFNDPEEPIRLPSNLLLIGTMNTSDQNVFTLDTAFQRRWTMRMVKNHIGDKEIGAETILDSQVTWKLFATSINQLLAQGNLDGSSSEDKQLGTYFVEPRSLNWNDPEDFPEHERSAVQLSNESFGETVLKYLWDDAFKFRRESLFDKKYQTLESVLTDFNGLRGNDRFNVFTSEVKNMMLGDDPTIRIDSIQPNTDSI